MDHQLKAQLRDNKSTRSELRQMRNNGHIPAVVYGELVGSQPITVDEKALTTLLRSQFNGVITLEVAGRGSYPVMVGEIMRNMLNRNVTHIDFRQINMNEPVLAKVNLDIQGDAQGVKEGGIMTVLLHEIEVRCLPGQLPEEIVVDISKLGTGDSILVADLTLPAQVELKTDEQAVIVTILVPQKAVEESVESSENDKDEAQALSVQASEG